MDLIEEKKRLRGSLSDSRQASVRLSSFLELLDLSAKPIGLYKPLKDEIQIDISTVLKPAWPRIVDQNLMLFSSSSEFRKSKLGFMEPHKVCEVSKEDLEVIFVPGLAFDYKGARLGRGRGFYDRYLSDYEGIKVGVCHWTRFLNKPIPVDGHDISMDWVLTDRHVFKVNSAQINEVL